MIIESFLTFMSKVFFFTSFVNGKGSFPAPLTREEEAMYLKLSKQGDSSAREKLIRHNLRLVSHIVKNFTNAGEAEDLISVGTIGLIKGIESYADDKGTQLATYCAKCIENEILMYIRANKKYHQTMSLGESVGVDKDGNDVTLIDIIPDRDNKDYGNIEDKLLMNKIKSILPKVLTAREYKIIDLRYGINGKAFTQLEVAKELGISRSYVSRIEKRAIAKISKEII